ncbi:MBL fold metallo-hydrolase [Robbsia sp. KACC 23696]|uniref:MBL fold metallo-hydrolase n=1 Tax=Robbsia sp. KACC 23696 TaxID=3149231 RepID=UPI00325BE4C1
MSDGKPFYASRRAFMTASCMCVGSTLFGSLLPVGSAYADDLPHTDAPGYHRLQVGSVKVTVVSDGQGPMPAMQLLQGRKDLIEQALRSQSLGETVLTSHNAFVIDNGVKVVLVDAGGGSLIGPNFGKLQANLAAAGYAPEQISEVLLTHLHTDHAGGLMNGNQRAFPNAIVRVSRADADFWLSPTQRAAAPEAGKRGFDFAMASLTPYHKAKKLALFDGETALGNGITARPAYGHTPGHTMYEVTSDGQQMLLWGDIVHVAAVQFPHPEVAIGYDSNKDEARMQHWRMFSELAKSGQLVGGAHLPFPGIGHVRDGGDAGYVFEAVA